MEQLTGIILLFVGYFIGWYSRHFLAKIKFNSNERKSVRKHELTKKYCQCESPTGREVDENNHQICTTCGLPTS